MEAVMDDQVLSEQNENTRPKEAAAKTRIWQENPLLLALLALALVVTGGEGYFAWTLNKKLNNLNETLQSQVTKQDQNIQALEARAGIHERGFDELEGQVADA